MDLLSLEQLEKDCFSTEAFDRRLIKNLLINPKSIVIKATTPQGEIIGDVIGVVKKEDGMPAGRIFSLCVLEKYRKRGIASRLAELLEKEFRLRGVKKIRLEVSVRNVAAQSLYKRWGYLVTSTILPAYYNDGSDALIMIKEQ